QLITFYGRGTGAAAGTSTLSFAPAPLQLPSQAIGVASAPTSLQLQNRGAVAITPTALVFNGPAAYDLNAVGDCAVGRAIPAGGVCFLQITFTPQAAGTRLANLVVDAPQLASLAVLSITGTGVTVVNGPPAVEIVEFHHLALDHYFLTAEPAEADFIDRGGIGDGWARTGRVLRGWRAGSPSAAGAVDVCRFFGTPGRGPASHFYTSEPDECAAVQRNAYWLYEGTAFRVLPLAGGGCPAGTDAVLRVYKLAAEVTGIRHRYVTNSADVDSMRAAGWLLEGPVFCTPRSS
ncbi:MAG: hypothetical protein ABJC33_01075, partial [Betaproteobacteria bacterium]